MPAIDVCEPAVIRALEKAGWVVVDHPATIHLGRGKGNFIYADLRLRRHDSNQTIIIAEVKCFTRGLLDEFYHAVGQYVVYRNVLRLNNIATSVYLALPQHIYDTFFQRAFVQATLDDIHMKLVIVDLEKEEATEWIH
jgi:hypothetical protein